jgi:hypothetical protein
MNTDERGFKLNFLSVFIRVYLWLTLSCALFGVFAAAQTQPVPYSHKTHLALGLKCNQCHKNPDPGEMMGFPASSFCMSCHASVKQESPHIAKIAASAKQGKPLPWVRVYKIPSYVYFSHRAHLQTGATCAGCHGPVEQRDVITKETDISMGACMDCHRKNKAPNDCKYCHDETK